MRAFLTGAGGFLGTHLASHLRACGDEVVAPAVDVLAMEELQAEISRAGPDIVFHLAGIAATQAVRTDAPRVFRVNVLGTVSLLEAVRKAAARTRVLLFSSADVYGVVPPDRQPIREEEVIAPVSVYGATKTAVTHLAGTYRAAHGLDLVEVRPFPNIGPGQGRGFVVSDFARQIARIERGLQEPRLGVGNLESVRDFVDVRDAARAYRGIAALASPAREYNVCRGQGTRIADVLAGLLARAGRPVEVFPDPALQRPVDIPLLTGSPDRLRRDTGWAPEIALEETLGAALDSWRARS